jgi:hypothetical protein
VPHLLAPPGDRVIVPLDSASGWVGAVVGGSARLDGDNPAKLNPMNPMHHLVEDVNQNRDRTTKQVG